MVFDRRPRRGLTSIPQIPQPAAYRPSTVSSVETELRRPLAPALLNGVRRRPNASRSLPSIEAGDFTQSSVDGLGGREHSGDIGLEDDHIRATACRHNSVFERTHDPHYGMR